MYFLLPVYSCVVAQRAVSHRQPARFETELSTRDEGHWKSFVCETPSADSSFARLSIALIKDMIWMAAAGSMGRREERPGRA